MQCVFCKEDVNDYRLVNFDTITSANQQPFATVSGFSGGKYVGTAYVAAMIECPHCDAVFFLKAASKRLNGMNLVIESSESPIFPDEGDISGMTSEEKTALYEKMKKDLIAKYT